MKKRQTTINHAFASAIAPSDSYDIKAIKDAVSLLGQDPEKDLSCVYCDKPAETWDHVFGLVKDNKFSGYGHIIGNLLPCCKKCNSEKGNRNWDDFIKIKSGNGATSKIKMLQQYFVKYLPEKIGYGDIKNLCHNEITQFEVIKDQIFRLMENADVLAAKIRETCVKSNGKIH
jgi:hypothetical protein